MKLTLLPKSNRATLWLKQLWQDIQWLGLAVLWVISLALGTAGFSMHAAANLQPLTFLDSFYRALQLITMNSGAVEGPVGWQLELARFLVPVLTAATAIKAFASLFREQIQKVRLWRLRGHIVICGLSKKGVRLARGFRALGESVVVIDRDDKNDFIQQCRSEGIIVLVADATDPNTLLKAAVHRSRLLISVCDNDGTNAEVALRARQLTADRRGGSLTCIIHIIDPRLCALLREREINIQHQSPFRLEFFNVYEHAARLLLSQFSSLQPKYKKGSPPHLVVVGLGKMGESLVVQAARQWRDLNSKSHPSRLCFTIIDRDANAKCESLTVRYPQITKVCEFIPLQIDVRSAEFERAKFLFTQEKKCTASVVFIALDNDALGLHTGLTLNQHLRHSKVPIIIRMVEDSGLALILQQGPANNGFDNLHEFSVLDQTCTPELVTGGTHEVLARVFHEEYGRSHQAVGETSQTNPLLVDWDECPPEFKQVYFRLADHIAIKLNAVNRGLTPLTDWSLKKDEFSDKEVEVLAQMEHERWCVEQRRSGWVFAPGKIDIARRTHPDLIAWDALPEAEKVKNRLSIINLPVFLAHAGLQIYKIQ